MAVRTKRNWERAMVTGASAGIGTAYARALAAQGTHLVLVARNVERLERLAQECRTDLGGDLSDPRQLAHVETRLGASPLLDVVVNNAGMGTFGAFHEHAVDDKLREIDFNIGALVRLTHAAVPAMIRHGSGTILNMSSIMALAPFPGSATYAASKAFVSSFSEALHEELRGTGVTVTAALPGIVRTQFMQRADAHHLDSLPGFATLKPEFVARGTAPRAMWRRFNGISARSGVGALRG